MSFLDHDFSDSSDSEGSYRPDSAEELEPEDPLEYAEYEYDELDASSGAGASSGASSAAAATAENMGDREPAGLTGKIEAAALRAEAEKPIDAVLNSLEKGGNGSQQAATQEEEEARLQSEMEAAAGFIDEFVPTATGMEEDGAGAVVAVVDAPVGMTATSPSSSSSSSSMGPGSRKKRLLAAASSGISGQSLGSAAPPEPKKSKAEQEERGGGGGGGGKGEACSYQFVGFDWKKTLEGSSGRKAARLDFALDKALTAVPADVLGAEARAEVRRAVQEPGEEALSQAKLPGDLFRLAMQQQQQPADVRDAAVAAFDAGLAEAYSLGVGPEATLLPGAVETLERLQGAGVTFGLIRNCNAPPADFQKLLDATGAGRFFHVDRNVVLSGHVGVEKPDRRIFEALAEKCGVTSLLELHRSGTPAAVFVGNETAADVQGARNAGWHSVLLTTTERSSGGLATFECATHFDLCNRILFAP